MTVAAFVPNLFDRSRFSGPHGDHVVFVDDADQLGSLGADVDILLVDLDRCEDPGSFARSGIPAIGFGPHVDTDAHQKARDLGFSEVMPRSLFFRRLPEILTKSSPAPPPVADES